MRGKRRVGYRLDGIWETREWRGFFGFPLTPSVNIWAAFVSCIRCFSPSWFYLIGWKDTAAPEHRVLGQLGWTACAPALRLRLASMPPLTRDLGLPIRFDDSSFAFARVSFFPLPTSFAQKPSIDMVNSSTLCPFLFALPLLEKHVDPSL